MAKVEVAKEQANVPAEDSPQQQERKEKKVSRWTLAICQKAARRFDSREAWEKGAPSAFKAACARGWDEDCCKHMHIRKKAKSA